jgi:hypothetical protein
MKNQNKKSRRINRKQTKRKKIKRKQTKRKQNKKIVYSRKKMYGGKFGSVDEERLKKFLIKKYNFKDKKLTKVMNILSIGSSCFNGNNMFQLESQINAYYDKKHFMKWLKDEGDKGYETFAYEACNETDNEDDGDDHYVHDDHDDDDDDF